MAHPPPYDCDTSPTRISTNWISPTDTRAFSIRLTEYASHYTIGYYDSCDSSYHDRYKKVETKKEKLDRVSKEKMLASWKTYNEKTEHIIKIKQICKPQHKLNYRYKK